jgi:hypothetical protein
MLEDVADVRIVLAGQTTPTASRWGVVGRETILNAFDDLQKEQK